MAAIVRSITVGLLMLGLVFAGVAGCKNQSQKWYGRWEGDLQRAAPDAPLDVKNTINLVRVTILPNGTFEMLASGVDSSGRCTLGSDQAFLTTTKLIGVPMADQPESVQKANKDIVLTWQEDGSILWKDPAGFDSHQTRLVRKSQP